MQARTATTTRRSSGDADARRRGREAQGARGRRHVVFRAGAARAGRPSIVEKAKLLGVSMDDVNTTLQSTFGAFYVNDFNRDGRVYRVQMQSEAKFRAHPEDLRDVYVRSANGAMVPLTAIADGAARRRGPTSSSASTCSRRRACSAAPAPGYSSGQALAAMEELAAQDAARRLHARVVRRVVPGEDERPEHARHLRARGADGVPDPRGAIRAPHAAVRGDSRGAVRGVRRVPRSVAARPLRRPVPADRPRHAGGPRGEERDPDRRVRGAHAPRRQACRCATPRSRPRACASGRS